MLVELSIVPVGATGHWSDHLAEALRVVDESGLPYLLTPTGTCIEGEWDEVMAVVRQCHERVRQTSPHVVTTLNIEDEAGGCDLLSRNVASVEERIGRPLRRMDARGAEATERLGTESLAAGSAG